MTDFTEAQDARDRLSTVDGVIGDECRRWVSCVRCGWVSPEHRYMWETQDEEDFHATACAHPNRPVPIDFEMNLWHYPEPMFTRRMEPLNGAPEVPKRGPLDRVPYSPHHHAVIYTDVPTPKEAA